MKGSVNKVGKSILEFRQGDYLVIRRANQTPGLTCASQQMFFGVTKKRETRSKDVT